MIGLGILAPAILIGLTYALLAVGYAVAYSSMKMVNFAHGEVFMSGALAGYFVLEIGGGVLDRWPIGLFVVAMLTGGVVGAAMAFSIQWVVYRPLVRRGRLALILAALGTSMFLQHSSLLILRMHASGSSERRLTSPSSEFIVSSGLSTSEGAGLILLLLSILALSWLIENTAFGIRLRAISSSVEDVKRLKLPVETTMAQAFALGGFFAGAAGVVYAKQYTLTPFMGFIPGLKAFLACIVGGRGIYGAVLGGLIIGIVEGLLSGWLGADWRDIIIGLLIIATMVMRPNGLLSVAPPRTL